MLIPGAGGAVTQSAQSLGLVLDEQAFAELVRFVQETLAQLDVESLPQAALQPAAWAYEAAQTGRLQGSYTQAQEEQQQSVLALRADLETFLIELKQTRDDLQRVDDGNAQTYQRLAERLDGAGRLDQFQQARQQWTDASAGQAGGEG